jgi:hypothetical protein
MGAFQPIFGHATSARNEPVLAIAKLPGADADRCAIVHSTREGACVACANRLPDWFILRAIDSRIERLCRVVWRDDELLGVQYVNARSMGRTRRPAAKTAVKAPDNLIALSPR